MQHRCFSRFIAFMLNLLSHPVPTRQLKIPYGNLWLCSTTTLHKHVTSLLCWQAFLMCSLPGRSWVSCVPGVITCCQVSQVFINAARMSRAQSGDLEFSISKFVSNAPTAWTTLCLRHVIHNYDLTQCWAASKITCQVPSLYDVYCIYVASPPDLLSPLNVPCAPPIPRVWVQEHTCYCWLMQVPDQSTFWSGKYMYNITHCS